MTIALNTETAGEPAAVDPVAAAVNEVRARSTDAGFRAEVARGIRVQTEHYAFPHLHRHLGDLAPRNRSGAYRALGIIASNPKLRHDPDNKVGRALAKLTHATTGSWPSAKPSSIGARVMLLPEVDMETAAEILGALISHAASKGVGVNFYDLTKTLAYWEINDIDKARANRSRIIHDYYNN